MAGEQFYITNIKIVFMKTFFLTALSAVLLGSSYSVLAQPTPPAPGMRGEGPGRPGPGARPPHESLRTITAFTGQAGTWVANDNFVYDGFYLQTGGSKYLVKFPASMGAQLKNIVKSGSTITINGSADSLPTGEKQIRLVSVVADGKTIYETPPTPPSTAATPETAEGSGKITSLQKNQAGDVTGLVLDNKTILRIPPHVARQLGQIVTSGSSISYRGVKRQTATGEVASADYKIVHCESLTANGTQYLTR
jgi:hypothetical protein